MARIIKIGLASLAVAIGAVSVSAVNNGVDHVRAVEITTLGRNKVASITNADLKSVALENYVVKEGKVDKKFHIPLLEGNYIDGAILFNDCDRQEVGGTLGDAFGQHNTESDPQAYNFNIFFSFEHIVEVGINVDAYSYNFGLASEQSMLLLKYAHIDGDFYQALENADYDTLVGRPGSSSFYANGASDFNSYGSSLTKEHTEMELFCQPHTSNLNIAVFQFTYRDGDFIDNGNEITCTINSLRFEYSCN